MLAIFIVYNNISTQFLFRRGEMATISRLEEKRILQEALLAACESGDLDVLEKKWTQIDCSQQDKRNIIDGTLKDHVLEISSSLEEVKRLVSLTVKLSRADLCATATPVVLLSDVFDIYTLADCEALFTFVESHVSVWKDELFFSSCKNNLLRMCNDLLRRLSRSQNTVFRGRILLFLASFFPFSERSGLNLVSEFNLENANEYKKEMTDEPMDVETVDEGEKQPKIDYNLFNKFLTLQDFFKNPTQCYNKQRWGTFALSWTDTFQTFQNLKLDAVNVKRKTPQEHLADSEGDSVFFAKYLTNPRLLQLQLSDPNFRRSLIIQGLIILQYLSSTVKSKPDSYELNSVQQEWVKEQESMLFNLLAETPRGSERFRDIVKHMLAREQLWNNWKNESCPEFKRMGTVEEVDPDRKRHPPKRKNIGEILKSATAAGRYVIGSKELNKLWNMNPNNMNACLAQDRAFMPALDSYLSEAVTQMDPACGIEAQYKLVNDSNFCWRALRLLAQRSPYFFAHTNSVDTKLPEYLESSLKQLFRNQIPRGGEEPEIKDEPEEPRREDIKLTEEALEEVSSRLGDQWLRLAAKLGYKTATSAIKMLQTWVADDEDATAENLAYTLEGLKFDEAAEYLKSHWCKQEG